MSWSHRLLSAFISQAFRYIQAELNWGSRMRNAKSVLQVLTTRCSVRMHKWHFNRFQQHVNSMSTIDKVIDIGALLKQRKLADSGDLSKDEDDAARQKKQLSKLYG
ncbi:hypothetical protein BD769DRAFT_1390900 [Suillus cothurnatus]|nr:hypothetical protein BD769DRAFT_1390900 [Suillus cothurnatus]